MCTCNIEKTRSTLRKFKEHKKPLIEGHTRPSPTPRSAPITSRFDVSRAGLALMLFEVV